MTPHEFIQQARWLAEQRGYKSSWVRVIFKARCGRWATKAEKNRRLSAYER